MESSKPQWRTLLARHYPRNLQPRRIIAQTACVGDCVITRNGDRVTCTKVSADARRRARFGRQNDGSRARTPTKKNRRILTTVKAMEPVGHVSILGRLTQPII